MQGNKFRLLKGLVAQNRFKKKHLLHPSKVVPASIAVVNLEWV